MGGLRVNGMTRSDSWLSRQGRKMAATTSGSSKQKVQPGDDKGGALTTPGADDTAPDDHGGVLAGHGADDPATHDTAPDDHGHRDALMRFFDTRSGGHFFTNSVVEQNTILATRPDLKSEGISFLTDDKGTVGTSEVFRFFNTHDGGHFFTASATERDQVLQTRPDKTFEGTAFYEQTAPKDGYVAVYRFFDTHDGGHLFTSSVS